MKLSKEDKEAISKAVDNGIKWLDEKHPKWWKKINMETLNMNSHKNCIIGQLYGEYNTLIITKITKIFDYELNYRWGLEKGFSIQNITDEDREYHYEKWKYLEIQWRVAIELKKNPGLVPNPGH